MAQREVHFPVRFSWGTSTSGYQTEGGGSNTDWWRYERAEATHCAEVCDDACDSWNRYEEDLDLIATFGLNSYRFSVEWARIEPQRGVVDSEALAHYRRMLEACHARDILPVVTLHHFTLPLWVADLGGFESPGIASLMGDYARVVGDAFGDLIGIACTINEPNIVALMGYLMGMFPPAQSDWARFSNVNVAMRACHIAMRDALRSTPGDYPIGMPLSMHEYEALPGGEELVNSIRHEMEDEYLRSVGDDDFIGVQCYTKLVFGPDGLIAHPEGELTEMGYLFWPECVEYTIRRTASMVDIPIIMTENGIGTDDDEQRIRYLTGALTGLSNVLADGIDVRGYFQWSLLDNFEWTFGYRPKFGIVAVDRTTFERTPKPSAHWYAEATRKFTTPL
jgi:beta-glucosidase